MEYSPLPPMIPISACANPPPERSTRSQVKLVIIQDGNHWPVLRGIRVGIARPAVIAEQVALQFEYEVLYCGLRVVLVVRCSWCAGQSPESEPAPTSVTVPAAIDHNRIVINARIATARWLDGTSPRLGGQRKSRTQFVAAIGNGCWDSRYPAPTRNAHLRRRQRSASGE